MFLQKNGIWGIFGHMFLFLQIDKKANDSNVSFYKGKLFEELLSEYLSKVGYEVELRRKKSSLEYDIEGKHKVTGTTLIGEAKAYSSVVEAEKVTSFIGKLAVPRKKDPSLDAIFLSTASISSESQNYLDDLDDKKIQALSGKELMASMIDVMNLPNIAILTKQLSGHGFTARNNFLLKTNIGVYIVLVAGTTENVTPSYLAIFNDKSELVSDEKFLREVVQRIPDFQNFEPVIYGKKLKQRSINRQASYITVGSGWLDYRFPVDPKYFIGRSELIHEIKSHLETGSSPNIIQVKSRSGVGKSSLLVYLESLLAKTNVVHTHDARNIKSQLDFLTLIQNITSTDEIIADINDVENAFKELFLSQKKKFLLIIDQFESTFTNPDVYYSYEALIDLALKYPKDLFIVIARKDDLLTTYDEKSINLDKLNLVSKHYKLTDFTPDEAIALIDGINENSEFEVGRDIRSYLLEFSQGFPWLLKRTAAHILKVLSTGKSEKELISEGLQLKDLFDEELEGLDEIEKQYLINIATRLPSTYNQLHIQFDEDPLLPKILEKLTQARLLRLTGETYDTYNDVFKEYLVYSKLPEFQQPIILRINISAILSIIHWAMSRNKFTINALMKEYNFSKKTAYNHIKEIMNLEIFVKDGSYWRVQQNVKDIFSQARLSEYIRRKLVNNKYISSLLNSIGKEESINVDEIPSYLKKSLPYLSASDSTWRTYSKVLLSWLQGTELVVSKGGSISLNIADHNKIIAKLGNISVLPYSIRARKRSSNFFIPSVTFSQMRKVLQNILNSVEINDRLSTSCKSNLKAFDLIQEEELFFTSEEDLLDKLKPFFSKKPYSEIWGKINQGSPVFESYKLLLEECEYTEDTMRWQLKKIINWGKVLGFIDKTKRVKY